MDYSGASRENGRGASGFCLDLATLKLKPPLPSTTQGCEATRRRQVAVYGQLEIVITAFGLIAGIIAAPVLPKSATSLVVASKPHYEPDLYLTVTPASFKRKLP
jgi:hypothetical protein